MADVNWPSTENMANICRLCLQPDDFIIDIFHKLDTNPNKQPLPDRIYELYQIKVGQSDGLPTNICHKCLYLTESFTEFRDNVRKCEARLQSYMASVGILGTSGIRLGSKNGIKAEEESSENHISSLLSANSDNIVTIIDPFQDYESSEEGFSLDSESEISIQVNQTGDSDKLEDNSNSGKTNEMLDQNDVLKNVFLCQYCDMAFTVQSECSEHESQHDPLIPHSCNYCSFRSESRQTVISHIKELHDNERPYVCVQCNKGFGRRSDLKKHTTVHTGIRPFTCLVCNKNFSRNTNLTKHMRIHAGLKPHVCQKCPRSFTTIADLIRHQKIHNDEKPFHCTKCTASFTRRDKLQHHEKTHLRKETLTNRLNTSHPAPILPTVGNLANPTFCGNRINEGVYTENMVISLDPFAGLNQEGNVFQATENLALKQQRNISGFPIKHQGKPANFFKEINQHKQSANCGIASSTTAFKSELLLNQNYNESPQPSAVSASNNSKIHATHLCHVCNKSFLRKRELQRHSVIHSGAKPFACRICNKRFNRKDKVVRHEKIHGINGDQKSKITASKKNLSICNIKNEPEAQHKSPHNNNELSSDGNQQQALQFKFAENFRPQLNFYSEIKTETSEF